MCLGKDTREHLKHGVRSGQALGLQFCTHNKGTLTWGPYNKDPTIIWGTILGSPIFGNPRMFKGSAMNTECPRLGCVV